MIEPYDYSVANRQQERETIASQVTEFLKSGGTIQMLPSALDHATHDPKCRLGEQMGLFL